MRVAEHDNCTGCMLCNAVCNNGALTMEKDVETGFSYPVINQTRCTECGTCAKACPEIKIVKKSNCDRQKIFALISLDDSIRERSTSGGAFYHFAEEIIRDGGVVAGAVYDDKLHVYHTVIECMEDLLPLLRSKYVQSDMRKVYPLIENALNENKKVMFCGTPCQVAAIKRYAEMMDKLENLFLIDLVCKGVPSEKVQDLFLEQIYKEKKSRVVKIENKDKSVGWHKLGTKFTLENGESIVERGNESVFALCFPKFDLSTRESCFYCRYKTQERVSDITIGDFWGMQDPEWDDDKGTSLVLINTEKGRALFKKIQHKIRCKEFSFSEVRDANRMAFSELPDRSFLRERFWNYIEMNDFRKAVNTIVSDYCERENIKRQADRAERKFRILHKWMELKHKGVELKEFFIDKGIVSAAIYGAGDLGKLLGEELCDRESIIKFYIDQRPRKRVSESVSLEVYSLDSKEIYEVDAIISTPVLITDEIENAIWKRFPGQKVYELEEIIFYLSMKHNLDLTAWDIR